MQIYLKLNMKIRRKLWCLVSVLALMMLTEPSTANAAYVQLAEGVYQNGSTLYIGSGVTSLEALKVNPSVIYCYAAIPPACVPNTFTSYGATLHVPTASMVSYFSSEYWYNFSNIIADAIEPLSLTMSQESIVLENGHQSVVSATVSPSNATPTTLGWSTTNRDVATVVDGTITGVAPGECDIIVYCATLKAICHVRVTTSTVIITLDKHEVKVLPNHIITLTAMTSPATTDLSVMTSDAGVALPRYVNGKIQVVGVREGTAVVMVTTQDGFAIADTCRVTVYTERGDVNCDGYVNIADVTILIDHLLGQEGEDFKADNADTDCDGMVNISDVTVLIDYLLIGNWPWEIETFTVNGVTFKMIAVEGGTFTMGATAEQGSDAWDVEYPTHEVTLNGFSIGQTEVTQSLWQAIMGNNPSYFAGYLQHPVEQVSWDDCQMFITKLNELTGKNFRLPTEAEWEFAARGGNKSQGYKYAGSNMIDDVAWYQNNSSDITHPVAAKEPNELGLYDMSGNVWEWCQDWFGNYSSDAQTNPTGPISGDKRMLRGGCWDVYDAKYCRVSIRGRNYPTLRNFGNGLRLAL